MGWRTLTVGAALFISAPAAAQVTNCTTIGNITRCERESAGPNPNIALDALVRSTGRQGDRVRQQPAPAPSAPAPAPAPAYTAEQRERATRASSVAHMIAQGQCDDAYRFLKSVGDLAMLESAISVCLITEPPAGDK